MPHAPAAVAKNSKNVAGNKFMYSEQTKITIQEKLESALNPSRLEVIDESHLHAGHGAPGKGGNFKVLVVSEKFKDLNSLNRHRTVFKILEEEKSSGDIHALALKTLTRDECT